MKTWICRLAGAAAISIVASSAALADRYCDIPDGSWVVTDPDNNQIGNVRTGQTPSSLVLDGEIDGDKISYRMQACERSGKGMMVKNHGTDGPDQIILESFGPDELAITVTDPDGETFSVPLYRNQ